MRRVLKLLVTTRTITIVGRPSWRVVRKARLRDIVQAVVILAVAARIEWALHRSSLPRCAELARVQLVDGEQGPQLPVAPLPQWAHRRLRMVELQMRYWPFGNTCLRRALVAGHRLSALEPVLVIGVRPSADVRDVDAHAWLRVGGLDLDPAARHYLPLPFATRVET